MLDPNYFQQLYWSNNYIINTYKKNLIDILSNNFLSIQYFIKDSF
jgi:hypothetical protein